MPAVPVVPVVLVVWASAPVGDTAKPNAAANPRSETILRRETIFDSTSEVIFNLLDFGDVVILVWHLLTTLIRTDQRDSRDGVVSLNGIADGNPAPGSSLSRCEHCLDHRVTPPQP
jgi:hypothetical protein